VAHGTNEPAAMGGILQEAKPTVLGLATPSEENRGPPITRKTTPEDRVLPRPPLLRQDAVDEVGHQPANITTAPMEASTHIPKPTMTQTADTSLAPIYKGDSTNSPETSPQTAPNAEGRSPPPAPESSSSATESGLHHTADPAVPSVDKSSTGGPSAVAILAPTDLTVPEMRAMGGPGGRPSDLSLTGPPSLACSMRTDCGRTQTSMATTGMAGMACLGTTAAGKRFYRFIV